MGIFSTSSRLTSLNLDLRGDPLEMQGTPIGSPAAWASYFGGTPTASGESIGEHNAMQISTVRACVTKIASGVAVIPLRLMERTSKGNKEAVEKNLYYLLTVAPNPEMTAHTFMESIVGAMAYTGNGYAEIEWNPISRQPIALWPRHPFTTTPRRDPNTHEIYYETKDGLTSGQTRKIAAEDMLHFPLFSFDGLKGISPIDSARQTLGLAMALEKAGARHFGNGSNPGGILINKGKAPELKAQQELRESWNQQQGGLNQGKTAFLFGMDWSYQQLGISNENSQWLQARGYTRADIAGLFGVPPHLVGDNTKLSGSNAETLQIEFAQGTLLPYLSRIEAEVIRKLLPVSGQKANKFFVKFNVAASIRTDVKSSMESFAVGRINGFLSINDVRDALGMNPIGPAGDVYMTPVNYQNAEKLLATGEKDIPTDPTIVDDLADTPTTEGERSVLNAYKAAYSALFRDAFTRITKRSKRDTEAFRSVFTPVLTSVSGMAISLRDGNLMGLASYSEAIVEDTLKALVKRAAKWPESHTPEMLNSLIESEMPKIIRSIHISTAREAAAQKALAEVTTIDSEDQNES